MYDEVFVIVDSKKYVKENCFVSQLFENLHNVSLATGLRLEIVELDTLLKLSRIRSKRSSNTLFRRIQASKKLILICRQRILFGKIEELGLCLGGKSVSLYEQDPWEAYISDSSTLGYFGKLSDFLVIDTLFVTSEWWSQFLIDKEDLNVKFVPMWMLPRYCSSYPDFNYRKIELGFKGTMHQHRESFFKSLAAAGIDVHIDTKSLKYSRYLTWLSSVRIYLHDESSYFNTIYGHIPMSTGLWGKDIEVASRGTFVIRNSHPGFESYDIEEIPLIHMFNETSEVSTLISRIQSYSRSDLQEIANTSVEFIRKRDYGRENAAKLIGIG